MDADRSAGENETERTERIRQLEALGALTGGVAHDFTNLLTVIGGNLEIVLDAVAVDARLRHHVEAALQAADDGSALTEQLIDLTRHKPIRPTHVDVHALLQRSRQLLDTSVGRGCSVALASTESSCIAYVDASQLRAAILNLTVNARDALIDGGRVELRTGILDQVGEDGCRMVFIEVADEGSGMSPETLSQATKPFFTTKGDERGTGLGLSTALDFAERSGGWLEIASTEGEGTVVKMVLPEGNADAIEGLPETLPRADGAGAGACILIVESNSDVRELIACYLRDLGYDVLEAVDGATALSIFDCDDTVDLVLLDVGLAGRPKGDELIDEIKAHCAPVAVLAMTADSQAKLDDATIPFVRKPFRLRLLADRIREALEANASR